MMCGQERDKALTMMRGYEPDFASNGPADHMILAMMHGLEPTLVPNAPTDAHDARHVCGSEASLASTAPCAAQLMYMMLAVMRG